MKRLLVTGSAFALMAAPAIAADKIIIEDFVGTVNIETASGAKLDITKDTNSKLADIKVTEDTVTIDGRIHDPDGTDCKGYYGRYNISWFGKDPEKGEFGGYKNLEDYPNLTISAPSDVHVEVRNSIIFGKAGDIGSADLNLKYCGNLKTGDIAGDLQVRVSGSADLETGNVQNVDAKVSGSGDLEMGSIERGDISISGSGDLDLIDAASLKVRVSGSGDVEFETVRNDAEFRVSGSGGVEGDDVLGGLTYDGSGSGDLNIDTVKGDVSIEVSGSSDIDIDDAEIDFLYVRASGASDINIDGRAERAELIATGASDIYVDTVTGNIEKSASKSADITIDNKG